MERKEELLDGLHQLYESGEMESEPYKKARAASQRMLDEIEQSQIVDYEFFLYKPMTI